MNRVAGPLGELTLARGTLDRASHHRTDEAYLAAAWSHPDTRVLLVSDGRALVTGTEKPELVLLPAYETPVEQLADEDFVDDHRFFLGLDDVGHAYFALAVPKLPGRLDGDARPAGLREVGALLPDLEIGVMVHAVALEVWHDRHRFCGKCGSRTVAALGGHLRRCLSCGTEHYPRTDPAVIMLVLDADDRLLLGSNALWDEKRFSVLAGFVEPGETLEQAVAREINEEVGLVATSVEYLGSQPWPLPTSLMVGFTATVSGTEVTTDDDEITDARWFTRDELRVASAAGDVLLPGPVSIARHLINRWLGESSD